MEYITKHNQGSNDNISGMGLGETQVGVRKDTFDKSAKPENSELLLKEMVAGIEKNISKRRNEPTDLTLEQKQLYCVYHYAEYINSGGHKLYLEKTAKRSGKIWSYVLSGLYAIGAINHASNFRNMVFWATRNFDIFTDDVKISIDDPDVQKLDVLFTELEERNQVLVALAKWARSWGNLAIISDGTSPDVMLQRKKIA